MSRLEELREKFRKKGQETLERMNSPQGLFESALYKFVEKTFNASGMNSEFAELMYARFSADKAENIEAWPREVTKGMFRSAGAPPRWVLEPAWCYHEGIPLEFVHQFSDANDTEIYIFKGRQDVVIRSRVEGHRAFYKMIAQDSEGIPHLNGVISY